MSKIPTPEFHVGDQIKQTFGRANSKIFTVYGVYGDQIEYGGVYNGTLMKYTHWAFKFELHRSAAQIRQDKIRKLL